MSMRMYEISEVQLKMLLIDVYQLYAIKSAYEFGESFDEHLESCCDTLGIEYPKDKSVEEIIEYIVDTTIKQEYKYLGNKQSSEEEGYRNE